MDAKDVLQRKIETVVAENAGHDEWIKAREREIQDRRSKKSVNDAVIEALRSVFSEIESQTALSADVAEVPVGLNVSLHVPTDGSPETQEEVTGRDIRPRFVAFLQANPGVFTTDQIVSYIREEFPTVNRMVVSNALAYEKRENRLDHLDKGLYRYPKLDSTPSDPNLLDDTEGDGDQGSDDTAALSHMSA